MEETLYAATDALLKSLREKHLTLGFAESCTGGLAAAAVVAVPGASDVFLGSIVSYANAVKHDLLGVPATVLESAGAVSAPCALQMARGAQDALDCGIAVSVTGIAGPDGGTPEKPVGTVFIGISRQGRCFAQEFHFRGKRPWIRTLACSNALNLLRLEML